MEDTEGFIKRGEAQTTQYASRSGALQSEYLTGSTIKQTPSGSTVSSMDNDGDTIMGGMKIDLHSLATLVAQIKVEKDQTKSSANSKPSAPWLTEKEVAELRAKNLCLRCKRAGHMARFCKKFGAPKRPPRMNIMEETRVYNCDASSESGKE
ncbi:hypothetical protein EV44_g4328 [Erysiphe necator]|uniref:CCHC-type domain-containing protein n=1 Tax=Uncinula necator TaxID=52586 RepID=A0A0B1NZK5_UNCNE|nr:hypothetical protein EV44_g4328 [Erysiphe necator]